MENFDNLIKIALQNNCFQIEMENESNGFIVYLINSETGISVDLSSSDLYEIFSFLKKVKKKKGVFHQTIDNKVYKFYVKFRSDFGEEVFSLKYDMEK